MLTWRNHYTGHRKENLKKFYIFYFEWYITKRFFCYLNITLLCKLHMTIWFYEVPLQCCQEHIFLRFQKWAWSLWTSDDTCGLNFPNTRGNGDLLWLILAILALIRAILILLLKVFSDFLIPSFFFERNMCIYYRRTQEMKKQSMPLLFTFAINCIKWL